ncbi:BTB/POZ domain-containing protein 17 isoform X1 [Octopus bimaculoides]|uniref:BTB domain-containing protein n=2 Tax=Octopus bimaculoides TaxID=37653 RepID=A0A0L8GKF5_OCTBM|nr:BTB/POZ domain-containing protein 17 isoform X1 [Octopus bimaculoides]|eukprot:XP_014780554.1 PREDICTED: BTB/POZ domain-containing protein 17-like isoform X1 [Octopus bimaculoides]
MQCLHIQALADWKRSHVLGQCVKECCACCKDYIEGAPPTKKTWFGLDTGQHVDNFRIMLHRLFSLYSDPELSDVQLVVGKKVFLVHKLILSMCSDVFKTMLTNPQWPESYKDRIVLKEEPECIQVFQDFMKYIYTGTIHLTHESVLPVLTLADKYGITDLTEVCVDFMCNHCMMTGSSTSAVSWLQYSVMCGHKEVEKSCLQFISMNFQKIISAPDFSAMSVDFLVTFLKSSDLIIHDEHTLFLGLKKWILLQSEKTGHNEESVKQLVLQTIPYIRFPLIRLSQLLAMKQDKFIQRFKAVIDEKINHAIKFHSAKGNDRFILDSVSGESLQYEARNYTSDIWSTELMIENYHDLGEYDVRAAFFSTPISSSDADENCCFDWHVDLYPKGVLFGSCMMIGLQQNFEIESCAYKTVRLSVKAMSKIERHVHITVLTAGMKDGVEYIKRTTSKICFFDEHCLVHNIDYILPYMDLNGSDSKYMTGQNHDTFRIMIIIKPVLRR